MITITRRWSLTLKSVFRAALNLSTRGPHPPVLIESGDAGYRIGCRTQEAVVEYRTTDEPFTERLVVPFHLLSECGANSDQPLTLEQTTDGIFARWQDAAVPQMRRYDSVELPEDAWPDLPKQLAENSPQLLSALQDACQVTDPESSRYALGCLQITGDGSIAATDGRQLLVQKGFTFPWDGEILLPASKLFGCKHLPQHEAVYVGQCDQWLTLRIGSWNFQFKLRQDGRFPRVDDMLCSAESATASFVLPPADREFLHNNLAHLPGNEDFSAAVTVDLNGKVALRAKAAGSESVTELILTGATRTGEQVRFQTNRKFLARAMQLGFDRVHLTSPNSPAYCLDENRHYLWALLEPAGALQPTPDATQIESPGPHARPVPIPHRSERTTMSTTRNSKPQETTRRRNQVPQQGQASATGIATTNGEETASDVSAIDQAIALRSSLRTAASHVSSLVRSLKREKRQTRTLRTTLLSLRQLQAIDA